MRDRLLSKWKELTSETSTFRDLVLAANKSDEDLPDSLKTLFFEVNMLEIALNKHFKPDDQFKQYYEILDESGEV